MLIIVRHGRTVLNAEGRLQGHVDAELDDVGRLQAQRIAAAVGRVDRVVSSPLLRAVQTAEAFGQPIDIDDRWIELNYGDYDGQKFSALPPGTWDTWRSDLDFAPPSGESLRDLAIRVRAAADDLLDEARDANIVVATHVSPIKASLAWALGAHDEITWRTYVAQASVSTYAIGDHPTLRMFNDTSHLAGLEGV